MAGNTGNCGELTSLLKYRGNAPAADSGYGDSFSSTVDTNEFKFPLDPTQEFPTREDGAQNVEICQTELNNLNLQDDVKMDEGSQETENKDQQQRIMDYIIKAFTPDKDNDTYLTILLAKNEVDQVAQLIEICPKPVYLDIQNKFGQAAIHVATYLNAAPIVYLLIIKGARIDLVDNGGKNIFHICAERGHKETLTAIINACRVTKQLDEVVGLLNERDFSGFSPFYLAVSKKQQVLCGLLKKLKVDVNLCDIKNGNSPLHEAVIPQSSDPVFVRFLLHDCEMSINHQNNAGITPLHIAVAKGDKAICSVLLFYGADVNKKDMNLHIPAHYTTDAEIIKYLKS